MNPSAGVASLADAFLSTLRSYVEPGEPVALVDFPNHPNVGDSAIWLGASAGLRALGAEVRYVCEGDAFSEGSLRRALPEAGTIFLNGGGNFGDMWPGSQELRERIASRLTRYRIVQLPQSMHFSSRDALTRARAVLDSHPALTLLWRDRRSHELGREAFAARSDLCPDCAFALGSQGHKGRPKTPMLWLTRTDMEGRGERLAVVGEPDVTVADWLSRNRSDAGFTYRNHLLSKFSWRYMAPLMRRPGLAGVSMPVARAIYDRLARQRLHAGLRLLSSAEVVVTDRLHGHILCTLLGKPHVVVDTGPGKITAFLSTWTSEHPSVRVARTPQEALAVGRALVTASRAG
ncbi:MAG TPA: polysaccharide pyruvyl transferase family protein [Thermoleophilaceae bacterium]|nr:polysaccharide pyruvyl transferase family protein [Thermoleophilaceae bacterium]